MGKVIVLNGRLDKQRWLKLHEMLKDMPGFKEMTQNYASIQIFFERDVSKALQTLINEGFEIHGVMDTTNRLSKYVTLY
ncbi:hypothetical protein [Candidatus Alkanophaga liquidiphilum]|nr:hypothetical protein [Candidatus Alkanophaga liquidiphilum]